MKLPSIRSKKDVLSLFASLFLIVGLFGPWLWRGYNPYQVYDRQTGDRKLYYRLKTYISPFFLTVEPENDEKVTKWFASAGTTVSGAVMLVSALFYPLKYSRKEIKNILLLAAVLAFFFFFLSLGGGMWLGLITRFNWGIQVSSIGLAAMVFSTLSELFS